MAPKTIPSSLSKVQNYERFCDVVQVISDRVQYFDMTPLNENPYDRMREKFQYDMYNKILKQGARAQYDLHAIDIKAVETYHQEDHHYTQLIEDRLYNSHRASLNNQERHQDYVFHYLYAHQEANYGVAFSHFLEGKQMLDIQSELGRIAPKLAGYYAINDRLENQVHVVDMRLGFGTPIENSSDLSDLTIGKTAKSVDKLLQKINDSFRPQ